MIRLLFLVPVLLCLVWVVYLKSQGYSVRQGKQGFKYILIFSTGLAIAYTVLLFITQSQY
nr:hypothetical protein [Alteromonas facilis]